MGHYVYKAYGKQGMCKGKISAASRAEAAECLRRQGLLPVHIEEAGKVPRKNGRRREQILLFQEWSALLSAGLPMDEVFHLLARHGGKRRKVMCRFLEEAVLSGLTLSEAMEEEGSFSPLAVALIHTGEESGRLADELDVLASWLQRQEEERRKWKEIVSYPLIVLLAALCFLVAAVAYILPSFAALFSSLSIPLPSSTRYLLALGTWVGAHWPVLAGGAAALVFLLTCIWRSEKGRLWKEKHLFSLSFLRKVYTARWCHALSHLVQGGMPLPLAIRLSAAVMGSDAAERKMEHLAKEVENGESFAERLDASPFGFPVVVQMVSTGMESGQLPEFLERSGSFLDRERQERVRRMQAMASPVLLLLSGGVTAFTVLSVLSPLLAAGGL